MKILVTGATGTLGRPTVLRLGAAGHEVRAIARSESNEALVRTLGATPVRADLFDPATLASATAGVDAVVHLATRIPPLKDASRAGAWAENDRIRIDGTRNLVDAAIAARVGTFIYPSVSFFYPDGGDAWIENQSPLEVPPLLRSTLNAEAEVARFTAAGGRGIVLRNGPFYATDAPNTIDVVAMARKGIALVLGPAGAYWPQIWVDDAATAVVVAAERAPAGTYDVVDDEPLTRRELRAVVARAVGRRWLFAPPSWIVRLVAGKGMDFAFRSQRISNRRFRQATGWSPEVPSAREGWERIGASLRR